MNRKKQLGVSLPGITLPMNQYGELAGLADKAGFDSAWFYEFFRNAFVMLAEAARTTDNIKLCTGLAAASQRTPFEMANAAADIDELSGGRVIIGTNTGGATFHDIYNGVEVDRPATRMKEYAKIMREYWRFMSTGEVTAYQGEFYRYQSPPFNPWGPRYLQRPEIPLYLGAMKPATLRLAGRSYQGILTYLTPPSYLNEVIVPQLNAAAEKAGRDPAEIDVAAYVITSVSKDREVALRRARIQVGGYVANSPDLCEALGLLNDQQALLEALQKQGPGALETATSDALLEAFAIVGTPEEAQEQFKYHREHIPHLILHTPYIPPLAPDETIDAFKNIVATFGPNSLS